MKILIALCGAAVLAAVSMTMYFYAQPPRPRDQLLEIFDSNGDDEISATEIENAAEILRSRDLDHDGVLTRDELPPPPRPEDSERGADRRLPPRDDDQQLQSNLHSAPTGSVTFVGGYETDPRDNGRPVALIAAALGVKSEVFRDAFSGVTPAKFGPPSAAKARANKQVLMDALGKYGITNDRLDEVSNHYRYRPGSGRLWQHQPATAKAIIQDGKVTGFTIVDAGSGYLNAPAVKIAGHEDVHVKAEIQFSEDFSTNGRVSKLTVVGSE